MLRRVVAGGVLWLVSGIALMVLPAGDCAGDCRPEPWLDVVQRAVAGLWLLSPVLVLVAVAARRVRKPG